MDFFGRVILAIVLTISTTGLIYYFVENIVWIISIPYKNLQDFFEEEFKTGEIAGFSDIKVSQIKRISVYKVNKINKPEIEIRCRLKGIPFKKAILTTVDDTPENEEKINGFINMIKTRKAYVKSINKALSKTWKNPLKAFFVRY